jgi:hypothetical protein
VTEREVADLLDMTPEQRTSFDMANDVINRCSKEASTPNAMLIGLAFAVGRILLIVRISSDEFHAAIQSAMESSSNDDLREGKD